MATPFDPGNAFRNEKMYRFTRESVTVVRAWPPAAWEKRNNEAWRHVRPDLDLKDVQAYARLLSRRITKPKRPDADPYGQYWLPFNRPTPAQYALGAAEAARWLRAIPQPARATVARFPDRQFHVLSLVARCPGALELAQTCPALAFALASSWVLRPPVQRPLRSARALLKRPRRKAAAWLGYPDSRAAVRVLSRVPIRCINLDMLERLQTVMASPAAWPLLPHIKYVNGSVVRILGHPGFAAWVSPRLLSEVGLVENDFGALARQVSLAARRLGHPEVEAPPQPLAHLVQVRRLTKELEEDGYACLTHSEFPSPPVPPAPGITPLSSVAALVQEGKIMQHCVATYVTEVLSGACYIYSLDSPTRCTVELRRRRGRWRLAQIKALSNAAPGLEAVVTVQRWLASASQPTIRSKGGAL